MSLNFNIYYLNFTKTYEMAMMINNVINTKVEKEQISSKEHSKSSSGSVSTKFLNSLKSTLSSESKQTNYSSSKVIETLDVKTTKSILLQSVIDYCVPIKDSLENKEGDLVKLDNVKLSLFDENSLRSFLILRRDALKGLRVEGVELNNLFNSMLQDYTYILCGSIDSNNNNDSHFNVDNNHRIIIKIPLEMQPEFENKYSINDLLIGHVSIVGIYKGKVKQSEIVSNTLNYFQDEGLKKEKNEEFAPKIIKSNDVIIETANPSTSNNNDFFFIDTIAIIQDVNVQQDISPKPKMPLIRRFIRWCKNRRVKKDERI